MPTLYVENVPESLYEALRSLAQQRRSSISAEVLALIAENVPTPDELAHRKKLLNRVRKLQSKRSAVPAPFPTTEELQREDRRR